MAIQSASEFEAIIMQVMNRIEKELVALGSKPSLETSRDALRRIQAVARDPVKLKATRDKLDSVTETITNELKDDFVMNQLWDLLDYIDYRT